MGLVYLHILIYLYLGDFYIFYRKLVGKYTVRLMDPLRKHLKKA